MSATPPPVARPLRISRPGAWYHVTARGIERRGIFTSERDRKHWLELTLRQLGEHAGGVDYATVSAAIKRTAQRAQHERKLMKLMNTLSSNLKFET